MNLAGTLRRERFGSDLKAITSKTTAPKMISTM
jgi:hypothetical protein